MSFAKRQWEREMERGWSSVGNKHVCAKCFGDYAIRDFILDSAISRKCDYCGRKSRTPIAAEMDDVLELIDDGIHREYEPPEDNLPYDSSEGGWQLDELVRARQHRRNERFSKAADLGPPPRERASQSRMSPAGIPMFYGSDTEQTAFIETVNLTNPENGFVTFGTFRTTKILRLLDLTCLPDIPSLFDEARAHDRAPLIFLRGFTKDSVKLVTRDGREHYEYVPTQVVAEYLRHVFRTSDGEQLNGIKFPSSRRSGGVCYSLFCRAEDCADLPAKSDKTLCLRSVRRYRINFKANTFRNAP
jgi:hypothetical protein